MKIYQLKKADRDIFSGLDPFERLAILNPWGKYSTEYFRNTKTGKINYRTKMTHDSGVFYMELTHFFRVFSDIYIRRQVE